MLAADLRRLKSSYNYKNFILAGEIMNSPA